MVGDFVYLLCEMQVTYHAEKNDNAMLIQMEKMNIHANALKIQKEVLF